MGLDVVWEGESGPIDEIGDPDSRLSRSLEMVMARSDFPILSRIDLYRQTPMSSTDGLVRELTTLRDEVSDPATREHLSRVLSLARRASLAPQTILNFLGD